MENVVLDDRNAALLPGLPPGPFVRVRVEDSGSGIPREIRDRIFEPFFTTKPIGKGTGLGLSTSLAIVRSHGGTITVESGLGSGTRFDVYLPANMATESPAPVVTVAGTVPRGHGELILMVDDEEAIRKIARRMLERSGYRVLLASEGAEAVTLYAAQREEIALVVTDMAMPVMDGPALIRALIALNPEVRIIGASGLTSDGGVERAFTAGIRQFLPKPYTAEALLTTIHQALAGTSRPAVAGTLSPGP
jgi:CheY-like chemotaxis protein